METKLDLEALKQQHKRIRVVETPAGTIVLRAPTRQEYRKFKVLANSDDPNVSVTCQEVLLLDTVVFPSRDDMASILDVFPGLDTHKGLTQAMKELYGGTGGIEGKD